MKVVLVTHDSAFGRFVAATLYEASAVDAVLVETARPGWRFYWRKLRRVGVVDFAFQAWLARWYRREGARALPECAMPPHERITSANAYTFAPSDLVLGFGTSVITATTLARLPNGFLNLHTGFLPNYRGVKSEFWALARHDPAHIGWTLHYMTPALDAGDIVLRARVAWKGESPAVLRAKLLLDAAPAIATLLRDARARRDPSLPRTPQGPGAYYTTPRWSDWRLYREMSDATAATPVPNE
ncbi:MAG TPA: formyltransferase family protein [Casimicrobiaceae bacterium]